MQNKATFEKAKALEAAGFPQPAPQVGQMWYTRHLGVLCLVIRANETGPGWRVVDVESGHISSFTPEVIARAHVYAPEATEILASVNGVLVSLPLKLGWHCYNDTENQGWDTRNVNPADACADAYLLKNTRHASPA